MVSQKATYLDDLVQTVSLHVINPVYLSGVVFPFLAIYITFFYLWIYVYGVDEYYEAGLITFAVLVFSHILAFLCCFWSVHVLTFLNFRKVSVVARHQLIAIH